VQLGAEGRTRGTLRRLVLTAEALLERRPSTYEVADRRQLASLAALVRYTPPHPTHTPTPSQPAIRHFNCSRWRPKQA